MKYRYSFLIFFIGFILQSTIFNYFAVFHMSPNLLLCLVVVFSFLYEGYHGVINGLLFGLINDVCFAEIIGISSISFFAVTLICIELKRYLYKDSMVSITIVSLTASVMYPLIYWGTYRLLGNGYEFIYIMKKEALLLVYHILITWIIYHFASRSVIKHRSDRYMYRGNMESRSLYRP